MTGTQNVNNDTFGYYMIALLLVTAFALYDLKHKKVKNTALILFLPFCMLSILLHRNWLQSILGFFLGGLLLLFVSIATNGGIGGGDIKLTACLGILYGPTHILIILLVASSTACVFSLLRTFFLRRNEGTRLPFVPFILIGCVFITI